MGQVQTTATAETGAETWQTEFEGHAITVHTNTVLTKGHSTGNGNPTIHVTGDGTVHINVNVNGVVIPGPKVLRFELPPALADPLRFRRASCSTSGARSGRTTPTPISRRCSSRASRRAPSANALLLYEASPAHHGPPLLWTSPTGQTEFPAPSAADGFSFVRDILTFRMDLLSKQGGPEADAAAKWDDGLGQDLFDLVERLTDRFLG
ncbi:uncharacterized protein BO95DRAFT_463100 [Aspergillus brunneoviolaceus CBS 621.78]|uniref:Uncharacterized protein n=1 Tax=Aspergillus brunneoviolaceus CBS 621.78 TaxID=1450534 RepID=A0ACD1GAM8_9EURO|nr:hypothetical protein BO95DRAFT_463100 [Aspergillus brunneoviolaceus CBS 621.78]RAH46331.1 hypothetical protein BO95DRAFT_463100 [Aspergillus brunneoviolaceus CBS 621.78]